MKSSFSSILSRDESGQELVEAALVLPILCMVLFAIFWFGRAFNINSTLERAARAGLQTASLSTCASCGNTLPAPPYTPVVTSIKAILQNDHLNTGNITTYSPPYACNATPSCTTTGNVQICTGVPLTCGAASCQSPPVACGAGAAFGTRVSFGYQFDVPLPIVNLPGFTISASAQSEPEQ
ncbi:MAG: TadE/TadG family type IV pilus assembly protein [Terriglobales bacterium]